jgi:hypothetical protein
MEPEQSTTIFKILGKRGGKPKGFSGMPRFLNTEASPGSQNSALKIPNQL